MKLFSKKMLSELVKKTTKGVYVASNIHNADLSE